MDQRPTPDSPPTAVPGGGAARPTGVTILAVLAGIFGVLGLLGSLTLMGVGLGIFGIIGLVVAVLYLALAYGFWTLQSWAWVLGMGLSVLSIVLAVIQLVQGTNIVNTILNVLISGAILYYLNTPAVKAAFGRS